LHGTIIWTHQRYQEQGKFAEAKPLIERATEIFEDAMLAHVVIKDLDSGAKASMAKPTHIAPKAVHPMELHQPEEILSTFTVKNLDTGAAATMDSVGSVAPLVVDPLALREMEEALATVVVKNLDTGESMTLNQMEEGGDRGGMGSGGGGWDASSRKSSTSSVGSTASGSGNKPKKNKLVRLLGKFGSGRRKSARKSKEEAVAAAADAAAAVAAAAPAPTRDRASSAGGKFAPIVRPAPAVSLPGSAIDESNVPSFHYSGADDAYEPEVWDGD
jgi:hypothetical protein